jgi:hypothetical protein
MKRLLFAVLVLVAALAFVHAGGTKEAGGAGAAGTAAAPANVWDGNPVTIRMMVFPATENYEFINGKFLAANPDIDRKVNIEVQLGGSGDGDVAQKLRLAFASGQNLPDIVRLNYTQLPEFAEAGVLEPLDRYVAPYASDIIDAAKTVMQYKGIYYAFPREIKPKVWYGCKSRLCDFSRFSLCLDFYDCLCSTSFSGIRRKKWRVAMPSDSIQELLKKQAELRVALNQTADMRPGSLVQRYTRCGKPSCHCAQQGDRGHGPFWSLTREVAGKTITKLIPPYAVEATIAQIAEHKRFRAISKELVEICERLCDARLAQTDAASQEEAKKGASKPSSKPKSSPKSRNS